MTRTVPDSAFRLGQFLFTSGLVRGESESGPDSSGLGRRVALRLGLVRQSPIGTEPSLADCPSAPAGAYAESPAGQGRPEAPSDWLG